MYHLTTSHRSSYAPAVFAIAAAVMFCLTLPAVHALPIIADDGGGVGTGGGGGGSAAGTPPLTLVSHSGTSSSEAQAGVDAADAETDSPASILDADVSTNVSSGPDASQSGTGGRGLDASASTRDTMSAAGGKNKFSFGHSAVFSPGTLPVDASAQAQLSALWNLTFDVAMIDFTYSVSRLLRGAGVGTTGSSSLVVRNVTTDTEILSLVDPATLLETTLTIFGDIGDTLEIAVSGFSAYDVAGANASISNTLNYSLEFAAHAVIVPEPLTSGLIMVGLLAMRRQREKSGLLPNLPG